MFLNRELSKKYLAGTLSPKENYQIEDRMLENDFYYDAIDGLEQVSWSQCQRQLEETESRIVNEFAIGQGQASSRSFTLAIVGILAAVMAAWYFSSTGDSSVDLTAEQVEVTSEPSVEETTGPPEAIAEKPQELVEGQSEPLINIKRDIDHNNQSDTDEAGKTHSEPVKTPVVKANPHITVGRVVDTRGIPVVNAVVSSGQVSDTTDKSGYYALKVPGGGTKVQVLHLSTPYVVEIDSHQNWEIVLDIAKQVVVDYYPMNAANRFK